MVSMDEMHHDGRRTARRIGLIGGAAAVIALGALGFGHSSSVTPTTLAGSGDAPSNTVYTQPAVAGMSLGATADPTTDDTTLPMAKPAH